MNKSLRILQVNLEVKPEKSTDQTESESVTEEFRLEVELEDENVIECETKENERVLVQIDEVEMIEEGNITEMPEDKTETSPKK